MADINNIVHSLSLLMHYQEEELKNLKLGQLQADRIERLSTFDLKDLRSEINSNRILHRDVHRKPLDHVRSLVQAETHFLNYISIVQKIGLLSRDWATKQALSEIHSKFAAIGKLMRSLRIASLEAPLLSTEGQEMKETLNAVSKVMSEASENKPSIDLEIERIQKLIEDQLKVVEIAADNMKNKVGTELDYKKELNTLAEYQRALTVLLLRTDESSNE